MHTFGKITPPRPSPNQRIHMQAAGILGEKINVAIPEDRKQVRQRIRRRVHRTKYLVFAILSAISTLVVGAVPASAAPPTSAAPPAPIAHAIPADSPEPVLPISAGPAAPCVPLLGDINKGTGQFPLGLVPPDYGAEGYEELPLADNPALPETVHFRDNTQGYNKLIDVALESGSLYARRHDDELWRNVPTPDCLRGNITAISIDGDALLALDKDGWIYTLSNLLSSPRKWGWIRAWGTPVWLGSGHRSPTTSPGHWSLSLIDTNVDRTYSTADGKDQPVSLAKCTQLLALGEDRTRIFSLDPWLANDYSYEVGTPFKSRFQVESLSAAGSVIFITNKYGDMYTKLYDYDVRGADAAQFRYTWDNNELPPAPDALTHRLDRSTAPIKIPGEDWLHQPKIPGTITNRISIHTTAPSSNNRELRVEGIDASGRNGYWHKGLRDDSWNFSVTGLPIQGSILDNPPTDFSMNTLGPKSPFNYGGMVHSGTRLSVPNFTYAADRNDAVITTNKGEYPLELFTIDGRLGTALSQRLLPWESEFGKRPAGLAESSPRNYVAAFRVPAQTRQQAIQDPELLRFLDEYLEGKDTHQVYLRVTPSNFQIINSPIADIAVPTPGSVIDLPAQPNPEP